MLTQDAASAPNAPAVREPENLDGSKLEPNVPIDSSGGTSNSNGQSPIETPPPVC